MNPHVRRGIPQKVPDTCPRCNSNRTAGFDTASGMRFRLNSYPLGRGFAEQVGIEAGKNINVGRINSFFHSFPSLLY